MPVHPDEAVWFVKQLRHTKGTYAGQPFHVHAFQERILREVFKLNRRGERQYREGIIGLGRKNGKTELGGAIGLTLLVPEAEPGGEVVGYAAKREQARLMHNAAKYMARHSVLDGLPLADFLEPKRDGIYFPEIDAVYKIISADSEKELGQNPHAGLCDELHAQPDRDLWDAIGTAMGTRENYLNLGITHAGALPAGLCYDLYQYGQEIALGVRNDPEFLFIWYEGDPSLDVDDERGWEQANPALGRFLHRPFLRRMVQRLPESVFRRMHLNQWTSSHEGWIETAEWEACSAKAEIPDDADVVVMMDAALSGDTFGVAVAHRDGKGRVHADVRMFEPPAGERYIDHDAVETYVLGVAARKHVVKVGGDPAYLLLILQRLRDRGFDVEEFPQSDMRMSRATGALRQVVKESLLRHGGNKTLSAQFANVAVKPSMRGVRIVKGNSRGHIDGIVALAMAVDELVGGEVEGEDFAFVV